MEDIHLKGLIDRQIAKYQKNFWSVLNDRKKKISF